MTQFCITLSTNDNSHVRVHAFVQDDGKGSLRDTNHAKECVEEFSSSDRGIVSHPPDNGERTLFKISLGISKTRRDLSEYSRCDYQRMEGCPQNVAEAGMDLFHEIKRVLRRSRFDKRKKKVCKEKEPPNAN